MRSIIKKILKYLIRILLISLALMIFSIGIFYIYINTKSGRKFLAEQSGKYLSKTLGTETSIGNAAWIFPLTVKLEIVVIKDHHHNNMFLIGELEARLANYRISNKHFFFSTIVRSEEHTSELK